MAPVSTKTGFIWKPEEDTKDVQVILSKARGIHVDNFSSEDNTGGYSTYILEQRNKELGGFSTCVALEPDTYHFLFRVDHRSGKQELRTSGLYPNTFLASGRKVNYIEVAPLFSLVPLKPRTSKNESMREHVPVNIPSDKDHEKASLIISEDKSNNSQSSFRCALL